MRDKLASLRDAVAGLIRDGDSVVLGACHEPLIPFAVAYELIRQRRRALDVIAPISDASTDMLIGAGCVGSVTGAWVGNVTGGLGHNYRRAAERAEPCPIRVHDHSNYSIGMALLAGAHGMPYIPVRSVLGSDILRSNAAFKVRQNPFAEHEEPVALVPALRPDVAVLAVQRSDRFGNAHLWGNLGVAQEAALAAERVLVLADEIVAPEVIASDPNRVLFPGFRVTAVVHEPAGVHPSPMTGRWRRDDRFFNEYHRRSRHREGYEDWLREWVLGLETHAAYRAKLGERLEEIRIKGAAPAASANFADE